MENYIRFRINEFVTLNNNNVFKEIKLMRRAQKIFEKISSKKKIHQLKYKGIKVGDLIYDTYLRYKNVPTIKIKDQFLIEIYSKIIFSYENYF